MWCFTRYLTSSKSFAIAFLIFVLKQFVIYIIIIIIIIISDHEMFVSITVYIMNMLYIR